MTAMQLREVMVPVFAEAARVWLAGAFLFERVIILARRLNRYAMKRRHKRNLKKKYGHGLYTGYRSNPYLMEAEYKEKYGDWPNSRNGGYEYWQQCYLTGPRQYAKNCTNRVIRAMYRDMLKNMDIESLDDIQALQGSDYEKIFDYMWTIW